MRFSICLQSEFKEFSDQPMPFFITQARTGQHGVSGVPAVAVIVLQWEVASVYVAVQVIANVVEKTASATQSHVQVQKEENTIQITFCLLFLHGKQCNLDNRIKMVNFVLSNESKLINMTRAWDKEKIWVPDGDRTHDFDGADLSSMQDACPVWCQYR